MEETEHVEEMEQIEEVEETTSDNILDNALPKIDVEEKLNRMLG